MCDAVTQGIISAIVVERTKAKEMFTALDVSLEAQRNHGVQHRHNDIKNDVHRIYADGEMSTTDANDQPEGYDRTLISIPGISQRVWLYHPQGADVTTYRSKWAPAAYSSVPQTVGPQTVAVPPLTVAVPPLTTTVASPTGFSTVSPFSPKIGTAVPAVSKTHAQKVASAKTDYVSDSRGRLWLPKDKLAKLAVPAGGRLRVTRDGQSLIVQVDNGATMAGHVASYKVHTHGVALSKKCFAEAGISGDEFDVIEVNGKIVVKAA